MKKIMKENHIKHTTSLLKWRKDDLHGEKKINTYCAEIKRAAHMNIAQLQHFCQIATTRNISSVSHKSSISRSALSRQLKLLEEGLGGITLMQRSYAGGELTEEGKIFLEYARDICEMLEEVKVRLKTLRDSPKGPLKIIAGTFGMHWFPQYIKDFSKRYPEIDLTIRFDEYRTLRDATIQGEVFAGLTTIEPPADTPYIWHKLGTYYWYPFAHSDYLKEHGTPLLLEELDKHKLICYKWSEEFADLDPIKSNMHLYAGRSSSNPRNASLVIDDTVGCRTLINEKAGIGLLPRFYAKQVGLVEVLKDVYPAHQGLHRNAYLVYPPHLKTHNRIVCLKEFILEKITTLNNY